METSTTTPYLSTSSSNVGPNADSQQSIRPFDLEMAKNKRKKSKQVSRDQLKRPKKPNPHKTTTYEEKYLQLIF